MLENKYSDETITIANSSTTSEVVYIFGKTIVGIITPSVMTSTGFSFLVSNDGIDYIPFYNPHGQLIKTVHVVGEARHIGIESDDFFSINYVKLVSNDIEAAERTITLILRIL